MIKNKRRLNSIVQPSSINIAYKLESVIPLTRIKKYINDEAFVVACSALEVLEQEGEQQLHL